MQNKNHETLASKDSGAFLDMATLNTFGPKKAPGKIDTSKGRDILDLMHAKARQGSNIETMCRYFTAIDPDKMRQWMITNRYLDGQPG